MISTLKVIHSDHAPAPCLCFRCHAGYDKTGYDKYGYDKYGEHRHLCNPAQQAINNSLCLYSAALSSEKMVVARTCHHIPAWLLNLWLQ
jgi:hypothetical protein